MIAAIIQARMGSTRTPGKTMLKISGHPLLYYCLHRIKKAQFIDKIIVATTTSQSDDIIESWCKKNTIAFFRGSENDVLDRYYHAAREEKADIIVRITSDCPFVDPEIIDMLIETLLKYTVDYASNRITTRTWPHGLDVEVFSFQALEKAWKEARSQYEREHVTPYIMNHPEIFSLLEVPYFEDLSDFRLTVDYPEDIDFTKVLIEHHGAADKSWEQIIDILRKHPELCAINECRKDIRL